MMMAQRRGPHHEETVRRFSRRWWLGEIHNLFWIALATVLIWIYADMQFTDEIKLSARLVLNTGESRSVALLSADEYNLTFELSGSQSSLERFRRELTDKGSVLTYDVSQSYGPGDIIVSAADLLSRAAKLKDMGISVKSVDPEAIAIKLDSLVRLADVPVELDATNVNLETPPAAQKVDVLVPDSLWQKVRPEIKNSPKLKTKPVDLGNLKPGKPVEVTAEILPFIEGIRVKLPVETVVFTVEVRNPTETMDIPVSVQIIAPAAWAEPGNTTWQQYELVRQAAADWRPTLKIVGMKKNLLPENVRAYVVLTENDKKPVESWLEREVIVSFTPGMNLRLQGPAPKVKFRLAKRNNHVTPP